MVIIIGSWWIKKMRDLLKKYFWTSSISIIIFFDFGEKQTVLYSNRGCTKVLNIFTRNEVDFVLKLLSITFNVLDAFFTMYPQCNLNSSLSSIIIPKSLIFVTISNTTPEIKIGGGMLCLEFIWRILHLLINISNWFLLTQSTILSISFWRSSKESHVLWGK